MSNTGPVIRVFSIGEDWVFSFRFVDKNGASVAMNGSGVGYKIRFVDKKTHAVKAEVLDTAASGALALAIGGTGNNEITGRLAKATASAWGKSRFSADLIRYTSSTEKRIIPVIVSQVEDGDTDVQNSAGVIGAIVDAITFDMNGPAYIIYDGPVGASGNTVLNGTGAPPNGTGWDGDFYIANDLQRFYGPKAAGAWPSTYTSLAPESATISAATYTVQASDHNKVITFTHATACAVTVPSGLGAAFTCTCVRGRSAGPVTFAAGSGVTLTNGWGYYTIERAGLMANLLATSANDLLLNGPTGP